MESLKGFAENTSIHGIYFISSSFKRFERVFWTAVVIGGFICAFVNIGRSAVSWSNSPIKTTIETFPISDITFPTITVCPPRGSMTNLNYDLVSAGDDLIDKEKQKKLLDDFILYFHQKDYERLWSEISELTEENRFVNWYSSTSKRPIRNKRDGEEQLYMISYAPVGSIKTPHFGESFNKSSFEKSCQYEIAIQNPFYNSIWRTNISLILKIFYDVEEKQECLKRQGEGECWNANNKIYKNELYQFFTRSYVFHREFTDFNIRTWDNPRATGFQINWRYSEDMSDEVMVAFQNDRELQIFQKMANIIYMVNNDSLVWDAVIRSKLECQSEIADIYPHVWIGGQQSAMGIYIYDQVLDSIKYYLNLTILTFKPTLPEKILESAARMYIYIIAPAEDAFMMIWQRDYQYYLEHYSLKKILQILSGMKELDFKARHVERVKKIIFEQLVEELDLKAKLINDEDKGYSFILSS